MFPQTRPKTTCPTCGRPMRTGQERCRRCAQLERRLRWEDEAAAPATRELPIPASSWEREAERPAILRRSRRKQGTAPPLFGPDEPGQLNPWAKESARPVEPPETHVPRAWRNPVALRPSRFAAVSSRLRPYRAAAVWAIAVSALIVGAALSYQSIQSGIAARRAADATTAPAPAVAPKAVTQALYDRIHIGMTEANATALLGPGELTTWDQIESGSSRWVKCWPGDGEVARSVYIVFEDGKAISRGRDGTLEPFQ